MKAVFLDTVGLITVWDQDDEWHELAACAFRALKATRVPLVTTTFTLAECGNTAARTAFRLDVDALRQTLEIAGGLIFPDHDGWRSARNAYCRGESGNPGLVDQLSFVVMRRLGLDEAFTNDRHFSASGFVTLFKTSAVRLLTRKFGHNWRRGTLDSLGHSTLSGTASEDRIGPGERTLPNDVNSSFNPPS